MKGSFSRGARASRSHSANHGLSCQGAQAARRQTPVTSVGSPEGSQDFSPVRLLLVAIGFSFCCSAGWSGDFIVGVGLRYTGDVEITSRQRSAVMHSKSCELKLPLTFTRGQNYIPQRQIEFSVHFEFDFGLKRFSLTRFCHALNAPRPRVPFGRQHRPFDDKSLNQSKLSLPDDFVLADYAGHRAIRPAVFRNETRAICKQSLEARLLPPQVGQRALFEPREKTVGGEMSRQRHLWAPLSCLALKRAAMLAVQRFDTGDGSFFVVHVVVSFFCCCSFARATAFAQTSQRFSRAPVAESIMTICRTCTRLVPMSQSSRLLSPASR